MPRLEYLPIHQIELDKGNPRIKQFLEIYSGEITAEAIALALSTSGSSSENQMSFNGLRDSIKKSGGIIHPILVDKIDENHYVAIEGNTRLQIYRDFYQKGESDKWATIPALVYENLSDFEKHEIRLQSHLVGPREWEPYSKAKYLWELSNVESMPLESIISLCGGRKQEIQKAIDTYIYMEQYYRPYVNEHGYQFNIRDYSKFQEYQSPVVKRSFAQHGFDESKFAELVAEGNIDKALGVRSLPDILNIPEAKNALLRENLSAAEKIVAAHKLANTDLSKYPIESLLDAVFQHLNSLSYQDVRAMATRETESAEAKRFLINRLKSASENTLEQIADIESNV